MKIVSRSYRYRFYPTEEQKKDLSHAFGCFRFVYNYFLKEQINYHKTLKLLTELKKNENDCWLKDVSGITFQKSLRDLDKVFTNFFVGRVRYPKFKKKNAKQSDGLKLSDGIWESPFCKGTLDRDINAAKNILTVGVHGVSFWRE